MAKTNRYLELKEAFRGLGMTEREAHSASLGREADGGGVTFSQQGYTAADFAFVVNSADDSTWYFCLRAFPGGPFTAALVQTATSALFNFDGAAAGLGVTLTPTQLAAVRRKLSAAWDAAVANDPAPPTKPKAIA